MRARNILAAALILAASCQEKMEEYASGQSLGEIVVAATEGTMSVSVDYDCRWRVNTPAEWMTIDVDGRDGSSAFSFTFTSNESDVTVSRHARKAPIVLTRLDMYVSDTLYVIQKGTPDGKDYVTHIESNAIELKQSPLAHKEILFCNLQGIDAAAASEWLLERQEDIVAAIWNTEDIASLTMGERNIVRHGNLMVAGDVETFSSSASLIVKAGDLNIQIADFTEDESQNRYLQMKSLLDEGYNTPSASGLWLIGGSFYYLSSVEFGYAGTPDWYPSSLKDTAFEADIYAWTNNLIDCVWMTSKKFNPTYAGAEGKEWRADYVYASKSAWNSLTDVTLLEDDTLKHKPILIKIKY